LKIAIKKYGIENFTKEILHIFDSEEEMNNKEKELVILEESSYNICFGGKGGWGYVNQTGLCNTSLGRKNADKVLFELYNVDNAGQLPQSRKVNSEKFKRFNREGKIKPFNWTGKNHSEETKRKIGIANSKLKGTKNSQYGTFWITNGLENKKLKNNEYIPDGWICGRKFTKKPV